MLNWLKKNSFKIIIIVVVVIVIFLINFITLSIFFSFIPWVFIFFISAVTMKSWSEEKRLGTIELLLTLPIPLWKIVLSKFIATWAFVTFSIVLTFPIWITVNYLGNPDNLIIVGQYLGAILMAGAYISLGIFFLFSSSKLHLPPTGLLSSSIRKQFFFLCKS